MGEIVSQKIRTISPNLGFGIFVKKFMVTKVSLFFLPGERKKKLWSHRCIFRESFLAISILDIYFCPNSKVTKNFPENFERTKNDESQHSWIYVIIIKNNI